MGTLGGLGNQAACRQAAWRQRHPTPLPAVPARLPRPATVYEGPSCSTRYLGQQRCEDCQQFCRRVGPGGLCPHGGEPVAVGDLLPAEAAPANGSGLPPQRARGPSDG